MRGPCVNHGYTLEDVASEANASVHQLRWWMRHGVFEGTAWNRIGGRNRQWYSADFLHRARAIDAVRQCWPRGPMENWRDRILKPDEDDE